MHYLYFIFLSLMLSAFIAGWGRACEERIDVQYSKGTKQFKGPVERAGVIEEKEAKRFKGPVERAGVIGEKGAKEFNGPVEQSGVIEEKEAKRFNGPVEQVGILQQKRKQGKEKRRVRFNPIVTYAYEDESQSQGELK